MAPLMSTKQFFRFIRRFFRLLDKMFSSNRNRSNRKRRVQVELKTGKSKSPKDANSARKRTGWLRHSENAKEHRRAGQYEEAEKELRKVVAQGEQSSDWKTYGCPPAHHANLAQILYHKGCDDEALKIINRYEGFQERHGKESAGLRKLKRSIESGGKRRLSNLYLREERLDNGTVLRSTESDAKIEDLHGVGPRRAEMLRSLGFDSIPEIAHAAPQDLMVADGIGIGTAEKTIDSALDFLPADHFDEHDDKSEQDVSSAPAGNEPTLSPEEREAIEALPGVGPATRENLVEVGFDSLEAIRGATIDELQRADGVGPATAQDIVEAVSDDE